MGLLILKTNINDLYAKHLFHALFDRHPEIKDWHIDTEDVDKVLRIEASDHLTSEHVIQLVKDRNFHCEELKD